MGQKVEKLIGFDATEDHRTFATGAGLNDICPAPGIPPFAARYFLRYPLREWGLTREDCGRIIVAAGLPLPPKSACYFCPASKSHEISALSDEERALSLEMERLYREGKHFRGDNYFTVKAVHKVTKEREEIGLVADNLVAARNEFRRRFDDTARPYRYEVAVYPAVPGLGRSFAWKDVV